MQDSFEKAKLRHSVGLTVSRGNLLAAPVCSCWYNVILSLVKKQAKGSQKNMRIQTGSRIYALRRSKGLTQEQLAAEVGVSSAAVSKWENQNTIPDIDTLCMLADYFEVTVDELLGRKDTVYQSKEEIQRMEDLRLVVQVLKLAEAARQKGLLAIGPALMKESEVHPFLKFVVDYYEESSTKGVSPEVLAGWLHQYVKALPKEDQRTGEMIVKGILMIHAGNGADDIRDELAAYFGYEYREQYYRYIRNEAENQKSEKDHEKAVIDEWKRKHQEKECYSENTAILETFAEADNFLIQLLLLRLNHADVVAILKGSSYAIGCRILDNMSSRVACFLLEDYDQQTLTEEEILQGQRHALESIDEFRQSVMSILEMEDC